jgi:type 2 lantibiotic biosynthesis protein LanM
MISSLSTKISFEEWKRGLYLKERMGDKKLSLTDIDNKEEMEWVNRTGLPLSHLEERLFKDGLNTGEFRTILLNKGKPIGIENIPEWINTLTQIFEGEHLHTEDISFKDTELHKNSFVPFLQPFLKYTKLLVTNVYKNWKFNNQHLEISESLVQEIILNATCRGLLSLSVRTLIYELNLARIEQRLSGETPELRFQNFINNHISEAEDIYKLLSKYPVLARLMVEITNRWREAVCESIERLISDQQIIRESFNHDYNKLINIHTGNGDLHCNGRSVFIMEFSSGERLVYKPRPMSIDEHFNDLINWINKNNQSLFLKPIKLINCGKYGWQEYVSFKECENDTEGQDFYRRLGSYIAIFHMLHATDMHMENMIAAGEHPQFIDLESLFHNFDSIEENSMTALEKSSQELTNSVLRTAILPASLFKSGAFRSIEVSGIGGHGGQQLPRPIYKWADKNTDKMRMIKEIGFAKGAKNRPMIKGKEILPEEHIDEISEGFEQTYFLFLQNKDYLLDEKGPIFSFKDDKVRSIFRHTQSYSIMLEASLHPENLKNGLDRVQLFDYLWRVVELNPKASKFINSETQDLLRGDIPYFQTQVNSVSIWDSNRGEIKDFFDTSALKHTLNRIENFSKEDCEKQKRYIRVSMATILKRWDFKEYRTDVFKNIPKKLTTEQEFLQEAIKIGDKLLDSAFFGDDKKDVNWIGVGASLNDRWLFTPLDATLYDGVMGMALFYAYLFELSKDDKYKKVAQASVNSALDFLNKYNGLDSLSAFHGYASIAYVFSHLSVLWKDENYMKEALQALYQCEKWISRDIMYDLIGGVAGTLLTSLRLYSLTNDEKALEIAVKCGEHLIKNATEQKEGVGWVSFMDNETALVGLSHGAAGIGWALAELYTHTSDERFLEYSRKAIYYERSMFMPEEGNWSDLRYREDRSRLGITTPVQWCHGAAGIALGRLMTRKHWEDDLLNDEIKIAINTTLKEGFGGSHCQCHGDFGNLEVLLLASKVLNDQGFLEKAKQIGSSIVEESKNNGWSCGIPQNEETPSLMLGLAGLGYGLLRLASPSKVPSVLTLDAPMRGQR